jgi:hypothetical protein
MKQQSRLTAPWKIVCFVMTGLHLQTVVKGYRCLLAGKRLRENQGRIKEEMWISVGLMEK